MINYTDEDLCYLTLKYGIAPREILEILDTYKVQLTTTYSYEDIGKLIKEINIELMYTDYSFSKPYDAKRDNYTYIVSSWITHRHIFEITMLGDNNIL